MTESQTKLICPLTARTIEAMRVDMLAASAEGADMVECRLDFLDALPDDEQLRDLLAQAPAEVLITCRPTRQGGQYAGSEQHRLGLLARAVRCGPVAAVDIEQDVPPEDWPEPGQARTVVSHHDFDCCPADLDELVAAMDASAGDINKVAFAPTNAAEALRAFDVVRASTKPTLALAMGPMGLITRLLARKFGCWGSFASLHSKAESAPGQPTLAEARGLYRWDAIGPATEVFGVIGCPISHSMGPAIHNAAFEATGRDAAYLPLLIQPGVENFSRFMDAALARPWLGLRGLSVTIPHKEHALAYIGQANCDELAVRIGAVNTITISPTGQLRGDNTDYAGAIDALCDKMNITRQALAGRAVTVLGAGGAARAIVAALSHYKAGVTVCNRTVARAQALAREFGCQARPLNEACQTDPEIIINCTAIGMSPNVAESPIDPAPLPTSAKVVFDTVYNPLQTKLLTQGQERGLTTVTGLDMFVNQAGAQYERWTGEKPPVEVMRKTVLEKLE